MSARSTPHRPRWRVGHTGREAERRELLSSWWVVLTLVPFGWMTWAAFLFAGVRARHASWLGAALLYAIAAIAGGILFNLDAGEQGLLADAGGAITVFFWAMGATHAFTARDEFLDRVAVVEQPSLRAERAPMERRRLGARLALTDPARARQLGVGRPDLPESFHAGLVDLNSAPATVIATLPKVDGRLAERIVGAREADGDFSSLADLDLALDLPVETLERLRERVVFLPPGD